jgi:two-component system response regulator
MRVRRIARILLVEDNPHDVELVKLALSDQLITNSLRIISDGKDALDYLLKQDLANLPDLVLLDLNLPRLNGQEILKKLRQEEHTKNLPVVIFTSSLEDRDQMESYDLGANAYIKKLIDPDEFKNALRNLDIYWLVKD